MTIATEPGEIISSNMLKTISNKGMPFFKDSMCYGNLIINFAVEFPKKGDLTDDNIKVLKQILPGPKHREINPKKEVVNYL